MSNYNIDNKSLRKSILWVVGITLVLLLIAFGLVYILVTFSDNSLIPIFAVIGIIVVTLGTILYFWYRHAQKAK